MLVNVKMAEKKGNTELIMDVISYRNNPTVHKEMC